MSVLFLLFAGLACHSFPLALAAEERKGTASVDDGTQDCGARGNEENKELDDTTSWLQVQSDLKHRSADESQAGASVARGQCGTLRCNFDACSHQAKVDDNLPGPDWTKASIYTKESIGKSGTKQGEVLCSEVYEGSRVHLLEGDTVKTGADKRRAKQKRYAFKPVKEGQSTNYICNRKPVSMLAHRIWAPHSCDTNCLCWPYAMDGKNEANIESIGSQKKDFEDQVRELATGGPPGDAGTTWVEKYGLPKIFTNRARDEGEN